MNKRFLTKKGAPKSDGTGADTAAVVFNALDDWRVKNKVEALCFDTTSANTGCEFPNIRSSCFLRNVSRTKFITSTMQTSYLRTEFEVGIRNEGGSIFWSKS